MSISPFALYHTVKGKQKSTHTLTNKEIGIFILLYRAQNAGGARPAAQLAILRNGALQKTIPMQPDSLRDGTTFFRGTDTFQVKKTTHFTARVTLTLGSSTDTRQLSFRVKPKK